jgi:hypothetical protein
MKPNSKFILILSLFALISFYSCQDEVVEETQNQEETIVPESAVADLMRATAANNGSLDDPLDTANCFSVNLPVTIIVNGITITIATLEDIALIEELYNEFDDDEDFLEFFFPITIVLNDYTEIVIENAEQLQNFIDDCLGDTTDVIECVNFVYPISFSIYNSDFQIIDTVIIENDEQLYNFLDELEGNPSGGAILASLNFPVSLIYNDGTTVEVNNNQELESALNVADEFCNNEEDCDHEDVAMYLQECYWNIVSFNGDDNFIAYDIYFNENGTLEITDGSTTGAIGGNWELTETDSGLVLTLSELTAFDQDLGGSWLIVECDDDLFELVRETGSNVLDTMIIERECEDDLPCSAQEISMILQECYWYAATNLFVNVVAEEFHFGENGVVEVINSASDQVSDIGSWNVSLTDQGIFLTLSFQQEPNVLIALDWQVVACDDHHIEMINGDNYLVLEQECEDEYDCPNLEANIGYDCITANGNEGFVNENCECQEYDNQFDCPDLQANYGDDCETGSGTIGFINEDCECQENDNQFDCPDLQANYGDDCETGSGTIGFINEDCECQENDNQFDCPELEANIGDDCETPAGTIGFINENCECQEDENQYDCPELEANIGDDCETANGTLGFINENCECQEDDTNPFECFDNITFTICDDETIDGFLAIELEIFYPNCPQDDVEITFHSTLNDAEANLNPLSSPYTNTTNPQTIYARVALAGNNTVYEVFEIHLIVEDCSQGDCSEQQVDAYLMECAWIPVTVDGSDDFSEVYMLFNENQELIVEGLGLNSTGTWITTGNPNDGVYLIISGFNNVFQVLIGEWLVAQCSETEMVLINNANNNQIILQRECN